VLFNTNILDEWKIFHTTHSTHYLRECTVPWAKNIMKLDNERLCQKFLQFALVEIFLLDAKKPAISSKTADGRYK